MSLKISILLAFFALNLLTISGCSKEKDDEGTPDFIPPKGFGISEEEPEGTALVFPAGLTLERMEPYNPIEETDCNGEPRVGAPAETMVPLCLLFRNNTKQTVTLQLPPGLIFISKKIKTQNGILIEKVSREIPAEQYVYVPVRAHCLNTPRFSPGPGDVYGIGPVTQYQPMLDLAKKLEAKKLVSGNINQDANTAATIQVLVGIIADKGKMDAYGNSLLDGLPSK